MENYKNVLDNRYIFKLVKLKKEEINEKILIMNIKKIKN